MAVDTKRVSGRREVRLASMGELIDDVDRLMKAEREGRLRALGNWTPGQVFGHLAAWIDYGYDGYPTRPPWYVKLMGPLLKRQVLKGKPPAGFRLPGAPEGTYGTQKYGTEEGAERLRRAAMRLDRSPPSDPNPVFGKLTHEQWKRLHLSHAELHLSFLVVEG